MHRNFRMPAVVLTGLLVAGVVGLAGCKSDSGGGSSSTAPKKSLYERLGGHESITKVVDSFVAKAAADTRVNFFRKSPPHPNQWNPTPEELATFKKHLTQFVEVAAGGPTKYEGKDMPSAHKGMEITDAEFNALAEDLALTLDEFKVPAKEKGELMAAVAGTRSQIVGK